MAASRENLESRWLSAFAGSNPVRRSLYPQIINKPAGPETAVEDICPAHGEKMKVNLYMAISANGMIAKENDDTSWISKEEWNSYSAFVRKIGAMIIGRRTYKILTKQPEFVELKNVTIVVVSHNELKTLSQNHLLAKSPQDALQLLKDFKEVAVAGGGILNGSFIKEGLVDEIILDIEPVLFGKGIPLFGNIDCEANLKLLDVKKISENELQVRYKVVK